MMAFSIGVCALLVFIAGMAAGVLYAYSQMPKVLSGLSQTQLKELASKVARERAE